MHSGLYYPPTSLKTQLCLRGREMMYERCDKYSIPYRKTGKLVVATEGQQDYIRNLHSKAESLGWPSRSPLRDSNRPVLPTELISGDQVHALEPNLSPNIVAALWCPETGIVDSHSLMESLEKDIIDSDGGELVYSTRVVRVDPYEHSTQTSGSADVGALDDGWVVQTVTEGAEEGDALLARTLINASGLSGSLILNSLLPESSRIPMYYARGSYASYNGPGISGISRLIYPCPETGANAHAFQSLGTHLTLDLQGKVRFGPDLQWLSPPSEEGKAPPETDIDFWTKHLIPDKSRLPEMHRAVTSYLPEVTLEGLEPDYVGIRPKLVPPSSGFQDFTFNKSYPSDFRNGCRERGPMISLLGIESPGLTASLAIAELVVEDMLDVEK